MLDRVLEAAKLVVEYSWTIWIVTAIILFSPQSWLMPLAIGPFISLSRPYIGVLFLVASVLLLGSIGRAAKVRIVSEVASRKAMVLKHERLHCLTADERDVLRPFISNQTRTYQADWMSGITVGLERIEIIYRTTDYVREGLLCDYNMEDWAYDYLTAHPELVEPNTHLGGTSW